MRPLQTDLSIYSKFKFEKPPIGITYSFFKPEGVEKLDKKLGLCEMVKEAHERKTSFYFSKEEENCMGRLFLGMETKRSHSSDGGRLGVKFGIFQDPRANLRMRTFIPNLPEGAVNYIVYSPIDKMKYEPDMLAFTTNTSQAEILLRAMTYSSGDVYESRATVVGWCAWLYIYPYLSGKVNYTTTGLSYGMIGRKVYPEGWTMITIPYQWIPTITQNLKEMKWHLPQYDYSRDEFVQFDRKMTDENIKESQNP